MSEQVDLLLPALTPCLIDSPGVNGTVTRARGDVMESAWHIPGETSEMSHCL